eukprot:09514_3
MQCRVLGQCKCHKWNLHAGCAECRPATGCAEGHPVFFSSSLFPCRREPNFTPQRPCSRSRLPPLASTRIMSIFRPTAAVVLDQSMLKPSSVLRMTRPQLLQLISERAVLCCPKLTRNWRSEASHCLQVSKRLSRRLMMYP